MPFTSIDARTGQPIGEPLHEHAPADVAAAARRAAAAFPSFADVSDRIRAAFLKSLALVLEAHRDSLIDVADRETALGRPRLSGEIDRTTFQLRALADYVSDGAHRQTQRDEAIGEPAPKGRPLLIRTLVPIGPVAVFAPSNFPFAFSVLGGDTAAALAVGNPVIVKAHPAHPALSVEVHRLASERLRDHGLSRDVLQLVQGPSADVGVALVTAPEIAAVAFTGSLAAGRALQRAINGRDTPIPFYGELSSVNPIVAFPRALHERGEALPAALAASITLGAGQFCTSPGVLILQESSESRLFLGRLAEALKQAKTHPMLTTGIREHFERRLAEILGSSHATLLAGGPSGDALPAPTLLEIPAAEFMANPALREEIFGPCCLAVVARDAAEMERVLASVEGSLTVTIWAAAEDAAAAQPIVARAARIAGRVLFAGVPTGVAVTAAQHHGGPWPSSTRPDTTSVGLRAVDRFLRPIALQEPPAALELLPPGLREAMEAPGARTPSGGND